PKLMASTKRARGISASCVMCPPRLYMATPLPGDFVYEVCRKLVLFLCRKVSAAHILCTTECRRLRGIAAPRVSLTVVRSLLVFPCSLIPRSAKEPCHGTGGNTLRGFAGPLQACGM